MAPGYSMRSLRDMGNPYQHAPEVSIVRTDTCTASFENLPPRLGNGGYFNRFAECHHSLSLLDCVVSRKNGPAGTCGHREDAFPYKVLEDPIPPAQNELRSLSALWP